MTGCCQAPGCCRALPPRRRRFCSDRCRARGRRAERRRDPAEYGEAAARILAALARRVGATDADAFGALWRLRNQADQACVHAIDSLRAEGITWAALGASAGQSAQGVQQWRQRRAPQSDHNGALTP